MVQFNLLPDVKIEFIKTRNRRRLVTLISIIVSAVSFGIFVLLFLFVRVNQQTHLNDLNKDIKDETTKLQQIEDLDKILTIQNQLNRLPELHDKKVIASRLTDYLNALTPKDATISDLELNYESNTMTIQGNSLNFTTVNKFADTLKFTNFKVNKEGGQTGKAFKDVVLDSFAVEAPQEATTSAGTVIKYTLKFGFDPAIFAIVKDSSNGAEPVSLEIPKIISTRSNTEKPGNNDLFKPQPSSGTGR